MQRSRGLLLTLLLFWVVVYPLTLVVVDGARGADGFTLEHFAAFVEQPHEWSALWRSLWISVASVVAAAAVLTASLMRSG